MTTNYLSTWRSINESINLNNHWDQPHDRRDQFPTPFMQHPKSTPQLQKSAPNPYMTSQPNPEPNPNLNPNPKH